MSDIIKKNRHLSPKFINFSDLILQLAGRFSKYDALQGNVNNKLIAFCGLDSSSYYRTCIDDMLSYFNNLIVKNGCQLILGFNQVEQEKFHSVYGCEMSKFIENKRFTYFKLS
jgi:hypothetical protein